MKVRVTSENARSEVEGILQQYFSPVKYAGPNSFEVEVSDDQVSELIEAVREVDIGSTFKFLG